MAHAKTNHVALAENFCSRTTLPLISEVFLTAAHVLLVWNDRAKARKILRHMALHRIEDIGIPLEAVQIEARKSFWRA